MFKVRKARRGDAAGNVAEMSREHSLLAFVAGCHMPPTLVKKCA